MTDQLGLPEVSEYRKLVIEANEADKKAGKAAKNALLAGAKSFFAENPDLVSIGWRQFEPYRDGESTFFVAYTDTPEINGTTYHEDSTEGKPGHLTEDRFMAIQDEVSEFLQEFREDDLEQLYGNGYRITITRDGIKKEEYYE